MKIWDSVYTCSSITAVSSISIKKVSKLCAAGKSKGYLKQDQFQDCTRTGFATPSHQTSVNRGPNSRFVLEVIIKALISKSSGSSMMITLHCVYSNHNSQPDLNLFIFIFVKNWLNCIKTCFFTFFITQLY